MSPLASITFGSGAIWFAGAGLAFLWLLVAWCLCAAASMGDDQAREAWGKPMVSDVRPLGSGEGRVLEFPRRFRVVEGALDGAGDEVGGVVFDWPDGTAA